MLRQEKRIPINGFSKIVSAIAKYCALLSEFWQEIAFCILVFNTSLVLTTALFFFQLIRKSYSVKT